MLSLPLEILSIILCRLRSGFEKGDYQGTAECTLDFMLVCRLWRVRVTHDFWPMNSN